MNPRYYSLPNEQDQDKNRYKEIATMPLQKDKYYS